MKLSYASLVLFLSCVSAGDKYARTIPCDNQEKCLKYCTNPPKIVQCGDKGDVFDQKSYSGECHDVYIQYNIRVRGWCECYVRPTAKCRPEKEVQFSYNDNGGNQVVALSTETQPPESNTGFEDISNLDPGLDETVNG